mmetsp:Transcript_15799/g.48295  ORF Transcript_15799/g.48295 Transcript_15799/m.48295 type:complete len:218 (-) Transcript_15799:82-735(-)
MMRSISISRLDRATSGAVPMALRLKVTGVGLPLTVHTSVSLNVPRTLGRALTRMSAVSSRLSASVLGSTIKTGSPVGGSASDGDLVAPLASLPPLALGSAGAAGVSRAPSVGSGGGVNSPLPSLRKEKVTSASKRPLLEMWNTSALPAVYSASLSASTPTRSGPHSKHDRDATHCRRTAIGFLDFTLRWNTLRGSDEIWGRAHTALPVTPTVLITPA